MKCDVIKDLLPMYSDNLYCSETNSVIKEHLNSCESHKIYSELNLQDTALSDSSIQESISEKKLFKKTKRRFVFYTVCIMIVLLLLGAGIYGVYQYSESESLNHMSKIIEKAYGNLNYDNSARVVLSKDYDEFYTVLFKYHERTGLIILEKNKMFKNRYEFYGGGLPDSNKAEEGADISLFSCNDRGSAVFAVYGDNEELNAYKYEVTLYSKEGNISYSQIIENKDSFVQLYKITNSNGLAQGLSVFDAKGKELL